MSPLVATICVHRNVWSTLILKFRFPSTRCIVTGGASGIGRSVAHAFLDAGARVAIIDANEAAVAAWHIDAKPRSRARGFCADVSDGDSVRAGMGAGIQWLGGCDVLVNAAAVMRSGDPLTMPEADFDLTMGVNVKGAFLCTQVAGLSMREQRSGCVINITSVEAEVANPGHVAYTASKGGLRMLTQALAVALAGDNIRVNAVGPGAIATPMGDVTRQNDDERERLMRRVLRSRVGQPADIASAVLFLASEEADYITGASIYVDGGVLATR